MKVTGPVAEKGVQVLHRKTVFYRGKILPRTLIVLADRKKGAVYLQYGQERPELVAHIEPDIEKIPAEAQKTGGHIKGG